MVHDVVASFQLPKSEIVPIEKGQDYDIFNMDGVRAKPLPPLKPALKSTQSDKPRRCLVVCTTKSASKIPPMREWSTERHKPAELERADFEISDTGVGDQPVYPDGFQGAWNRIEKAAMRQVIRWILERLPRFLSAKDMVGKILRYLPLSLLICILAILPNPPDYAAVQFCSVESDFLNLTDGHDAPNFVGYEWVTGAYTTLRGGGPKGDPKVLNVLGTSPTIKQHLTYGCLMGIFGLDPKNWHEAVCGDPRLKFIEEMLRLDVQSKQIATQSSSFLGFSCWLFRTIANVVFSRNMLYISCGFWVITGLYVSKLPLSLEVDWY